MKAQLDTKWVEVFNRIAAPGLVEFELDPDRFRFKGMHRGHAIFTYVLIHRDYDVDLFDEVRKYVDAYRTNVNQLAEMKSAKISIKRKHGDFYYKCNQYHVWYYFIHFNEPALRSRNDVSPKIADLDRYWMLISGKQFIMFNSGEIRLSNYHEELGIMEITATVTKPLFKRMGSPEKCARHFYGMVIHTLREMCAVNYVEFYLQLPHLKTEYYLAGVAKEKLFVIKEYELE
jgi:hypothetical protein